MTSCELGFKCGINLKKHLEEICFNGKHIVLRAGKPKLEFPSFVAGLPGQKLFHFSVTYLGMDLGGKERLRSFLSSLCLPLIATYPWHTVLDAGSFLLLAHMAWDHLPCCVEPGRATLYNASPQYWGHASETQFSVRIYRLHL